MNKKGQNVTLVWQTIIFFVVWLVAGLIWGMWLDGVYAALVGCVTALALLGVFNIIIHVGGR